MNISNSQVNRLRHFVRAGLRSLFRPEPQTAVEWADANYYLPKESAYQEGRWETLPFQRAIMNAMGSDYIREVNVVKSARVGYSKMLLGVYAYFIEHKQRNTLMGRSEENNITQSGGTEWSKRDKSTYDPTDDIEAYALNASGVVNIIVFDPKGWALFRSFKAVREKLDTRRGSHSELETAVKDLGKAVSYKGMYGDVAIVVYSGQYVENGVKKNFLPDNTMVLGNTHARGLRTYGCIQDADAQREGINASARYPKNWVTTGDPAREFTMIQSAPLMLLADPDEFVAVQLA
ncbi:hypothetical protein GW230_21715 [Escherichia coli]|nr:hypothetical protein [Escherichia coli]